MGNFTPRPPVPTISMDALSNFYVDPWTLVTPHRKRHRGKRERR
jgi:hypothetical protein